MNELPPQHKKFIEAYSSLWDALPMLLPSQPKISRCGKVFCPSPPIFDMRGIQRLYELSRCVGIDHILPSPCSSDGKVCLRLPSDQLLPPVDLPPCFDERDNPNRILHDFPLLLCAQVSSFAPPSPQRLYVDPFGGNAWSTDDQGLSRRWIAPRSSPDNWDPWYFPSHPLLFFSVFLPDAVKLEAVLAHVDLSVFSGFIAFRIRGRHSDIINQLADHPSSHFRFVWPNGIAIYFSSVGKFPVPPVVRTIETSTSEDVFASIQIKHVIPASKIAFWTMLAQPLPTKIIYPVCAGFIFGRGMRYSGCRHSSFFHDNAIMGPEDAEFMHTQATADLNAGFSTVVPQSIFCNSHTSMKFVQTKLSKKRRVIVNPSSVNSSTYEQERRDPFPTALLLASVIRSPQFGPNTILLIFDAKNAYKQVPVSAADLHLLLEFDSILGLILGLRQQWGHQRAGWNWVDVSILFASIIQLCCLFLCLPYVDDYAVPVPPKDGRPDWPRAYQLAKDIVALSELLGIEMAKWQIGTSVEYLGYSFDTVTMQLAMTPKWIANLSQYLVTVTAKKAITVQELSSLAGRLVRLCSVLPTRRHLLQPIFRLISIRSKGVADPSHVFARLDKTLRGDIVTLAKSIRLIAPSIPMQIPNIHRMRRIYCDASGKAGAWVCPHIELFSRHEWSVSDIDCFFVRDTFSIPAMEGWSIYAAAHFLVQLGFALSDFVFFTDSETFLRAYRKGYSPVLLMTDIIIRINQLAHPTPLTLYYVETKSNPADLPTRLPSQASRPICLLLDGRQCAESTHHWPRLQRTLNTS
jgi:hypothetical protein